MNNNYIKVQVIGKNINNYIRWLLKQKIDIIYLKIIKYNQLEITIKYNDYNKLKKYSKTYQIKIIKKYGIIKLKEFIKNNSYLFIIIFFSILLLYFLSNIIFSVEVIYNDKEVINYIKKELKKYDIEKYKLKKKHIYLNQVKEEILKNNKDTIEWLEIIEDGTKYKVKLVERKKIKKANEFEHQSISASKDAIITSIKVQSGEKIKEKNEYVKKDEIIVSGEISKPDGTIIYTKAQGVIHGEVWYKVDVEYPYVYKEEKLTGKNKNVFVIKFLNQKFYIFPYKKYKEFFIESKIIIENNILPITFSKEKQYEVIIKDEIYTYEEAISNAIEIAKNRLLQKNSKIKSIKKVEILNKQTIGSKVKLNLFISVEEDITKIIELKKEEQQ